MRDEDNDDDDIGMKSESAKRRPKVPCQRKIVLRKLIVHTLMVPYRMRAVRTFCVSHVVDARTDFRQCGNGKCVCVFCMPAIASNRVNNNAVIQLSHR